MATTLEVHVPPWRRASRGRLRRCCSACSTARSPTARATSAASRICCRCSTCWCSTTPTRARSAAWLRRMRRELEQAARRGRPALDRRRARARDLAGSRVAVRPGPAHRYPALRSLVRALADGGNALSDRIGTRFFSHAVDASGRCAHERERFSASVPSAGREGRHEREGLRMSVPAATSCTTRATPTTRRVELAATTPRTCAPRDHRTPAGARQRHRHRAAAVAHRGDARRVRQHADDCFALYAPHDALKVRATSTRAHRARARRRSSARARRHGRRLRALLPLPRSARRSSRQSSSSSPRRWCRRSAALRAYGAACFAPGTPVLAGAHALMLRVHARVRLRERRDRDRHAAGRGAARRSTASARTSRT